MSDTVSDAKERLERSDLDSGDLLAASHVHRYELAAELCDGLRVLDLCCGTGYGARAIARRAVSVHGVDIDSDAIVAAERETSHEKTVTFERADALAFLRAQAQRTFDAIVCFEGIEHVPDPAGLGEELARHADGGARLILSIPNSRGFEERNPFHRTEFGYEEMSAFVARFAEPIVLRQYLGEASLVLAEDGGTGPLEGHLDSAQRLDAAWANHWIVLVGFDAGAVATTRARLSLLGRALDNAYLRQLERANADLRRTNMRMAREWLGVHDAAAASVVKRLEEARDEALARAAAAEVQMNAANQAAADHNLARQRLERRLAAPRYRAVDAVRDRLRSVPGVSRAAAAIWRLITRRWQQERADAGSSQTRNDR